MAGLVDDLDDEQMAQLAPAFRVEQFAADEAVVRVGEPADRWFVIEQGMASVNHVDLTGQPVQVAVLGPGQTFGESALVRGAPLPRTATVCALTPLTVRSLAREDFHALLEQGVAERLTHRLDLMQIDLVLKRASPFASLPSETLWALARQLRPRHVAAGDVVVREGGPGAAFYLVRSGRLQVTRGGRRVATLREGDSFGEVAIVTGAPRNATVRAIEDADLLELSRDDFLSLVQQHQSAAGFVRELLRIRFRGAPTQSLLLPDPVTTVMPLLGARRRARYWMVLLAGLVLFAMLTVLAVLTDNRWSLYAVMALGSLIGPVVFVMYLAESNVLAERPWELLATAVVGACLGLPLAIGLQRASGIVPGDLNQALMVAAIEEPAKALGVVWLLWRPSLRFRMDGVIFGAAGGMGFAALETALYSIARIENVDTLLGTLWLRALLSPFTHGTWTVIVCATIWSERVSRLRRRLPMIVGAFAASVVLHGLWDWRPLPVPWNLAWTLAVAWLSVIALRAVLHTARREEVGSVFALAPEIAQTRPGAPLLRCSGCGRVAPAGAHYCPRCGLALHRTARA